MRDLEEFHYIITDSTQIKSINEADYLCIVDALVLCRHKMNACKRERTARLMLADWLARPGWCTGRDAYWLIDV